MNWLRLTTPVLGGSLVTVGAWATTRYGIDSGILAAIVVGCLVAVAPWALARAKRRTARWWRRRQHADPVAYRAPAPTDREATHARVEAALDAADELTARHEKFPEGDGFAVAHTGIHSTYVRVSDDHVVVTGEDAVVDRVTDALSPAVGSLAPVMANPLRSPAPVKGAPRVGVWLTLLIAALVASMTLTAAAYPADAYNPAERTVLVGLDLHADAAPGVSPAEANLRKARFLVRALSEEAIEIRWLGNQSRRIESQAHDAAVIRADARSALDRALAAGAPGQSVAAIERQLQTASTRVDNALADARSNPASTADSQSQQRATATTQPGDSVGSRVRLPTHS